MKLRVFFHNHCFDGAASAAVFTRFYTCKFHPDAQLPYTGWAHRVSHLFDESESKGKKTAIVDLKYCTSPKITGCFNHHKSVFWPPDAARHFQQDHSGRKF